MNRGTTISVALPVPSAYFTPPTTLCGIGDAAQDKIAADQENHRLALEMLMQQSQQQQTTALEVWKAQREDAQNAQAVQRATDLQQRLLDQTQMAADRSAAGQAELTKAGASAQSRLMKGLVVVAGLGFLLYAFVKSRKTAPPADNGETF